MKKATRKLFDLCFSDDKDTPEIVQRARELIELHHADVNAVSEFGNRPLEAAACNNHPGLCELLIEKGANLYSYNSDDGCHPLYLAAYQGHVDACRILIKNGADVNKDRERYTSKPIDFPACKEALAQIEKERSQPVPVAPPAPPADEPSASEAQRAEKLQAAKHKLAKYMRNEDELGRTPGRS